MGCLQRHPEPFLDPAEGLRHGLVQTGQAVLDFVGKGHGSAGVVAGDGVFRRRLQALLQRFNWQQGLQTVTAGRSQGMSGGVDPEQKATASAALFQRALQAAAVEQPKEPGLNGSCRRFGQEQQRERDLREAPVQVRSGSRDLSPSDSAEMVIRVGDRVRERRRCAKSSVASLQAEATGSTGGGGFNQTLLAGGTKHARMLAGRPALSKVESGCCEGLRRAAGGCAPA